MNFDVVLFNTTNEEKEASDINKHERSELTCPDYKKQMYYMTRLNVICPPPYISNQSFLKELYKLFFASVLLSKKIPLE